MRDILVTLIVVGSLPLILTRAWLGILVFAWISYMNPHRLAWGFAHDMPFAAVVAATTLLAFIFSKDKRGLPGGALVVVWILWILWMNVTTLFALEPEAAAWEWSRSMKIQLMALATVMMLQAPERIKAFVWVLVISIGFYGVKGGIFAIASGGSYRVWGPEGTFFAGTNPLALTMLMILPLMMFLYQHTQHRYVRIGLGGSMLLTSLAIVSTYSRGAFVAGAAVTAYLLLKARRKWLFAPVMIVAVAGVLAFMPDKYFDRMGTIAEYEEDRSAMGRIHAWTVAYEVAKDRPLTGGGFQMMSQELFRKYLPGETPHDTHSIYFEVLGEQGFIGFGLYLCLMWLAMRTGKRVRQLTKGMSELKWAYDLASMLQVSIVAYAVGGAFLGLAYFDLYYHLIALLLLVRILVEKSPAAEPAPGSISFAGQGGLKPVPGPTSSWRR